MRAPTILVTVFLAAPPVMGQDNVMTAGTLLDACTREDETWISFCNGFFQAVHDKGAAEGRICLPAGTTRTDIVTAFDMQARAILEAAPTTAQVGGARLAELTLEAVYPCP